MFKNILIATDGSDLAEKAVQQGLNVAEALKANALVVRATPVARMFIAEGVVVMTPPEVREQVARDRRAFCTDQDAGVRGAVLSSKTCTARWPHDFEEFAQQSLPVPSP